MHSLSGQLPRRLTKGFRMDIKKFTGVFILSSDIKRNTCEFWLSSTDIPASSLLPRRCMRSGLLFCDHSSAKKRRACQPDRESRKGKCKTQILVERYSSKIFIYIYFSHTLGSGATARPWFWNFRKSKKRCVGRYELGDGMFFSSRCWMTFFFGLECILY